MKLPRLCLLTMALCAFSGAASAAPPAKLTCSKEVRKMSFADNTLFRDVLTGLGGLGMMDTAGYPHSSIREVAKIEVAVPYDNHRKGVERWTVRHDEGQLVSYLISFAPDGQGGSYFSVRRDKSPPAAGANSPTESPPGPPH